MLVAAKEDEWGPKSQKAGLMELFEALMAATSEEA